MFQTLFRCFVITGLLSLSSSVFALSAGDIQLKSWLGEPLKAQLQLRHTGDLSTSQIKVRRASRDIHQRYDIAQTGFTQRLVFSLEQNDQGINVGITTEDPIKEPYQHFILQILWPEGELYKEFKLLIDPKH